MEVVMEVTAVIMMVVAVLVVNMVAAARERAIESCTSESQLLHVLRGLEVVDDGVQARGVGRLLSNRGWGAGVAR